MDFGEIRAFLLTNRRTEQKIVKNTLWLGASNIANRLIKLVLMVYAARMLGTSGYGVFSYALGLFVLFEVIADAGINALLAREVSASPEKDHREFIFTSLVIRIFLIAISVTALILIAPLFTKIPEAVELLPVVALLLAIDALRNFALAINRGKERMELEAVINVATNVAIVTVGLASLFIFASSKALTVAYAFGSGIGLLTAAILLRKHFQGIWRSFNKKIVLGMMRDAWPFALLGLSGVIMINTDLVMLGALRSTSEVGLYSAAQKPIQVLFSIPAILAAAFFPAVTRFVNIADQKLRSVMEKTITTTLLLGIPIVFGGAVLAKQIIELLFGGAYVDATLTFQLLLITLLIIFPSAVIAHAIFAYNRAKNFIGFLILGVIGNVILNIVLIPEYGIVGSAFATIGATIAANGFIWLKMKGINNFVVLPHLKRIIPATIVMTVLTIIMRTAGINLLVNVLISILIYFTLLRLMKEPLLKTARGLISAK